MGLTGGLGSGKSTLARSLLDFGAAVTDADRLVEELYRPGGAAVKPLVEAFGPRILSPEGGIDRRALGAFISQDPKILATLNGIVHPLVRGEITRWLEAMDQGKQAPAVAIVEAALLVETGAYRAYHRLVVVVAPKEERLRRAVASGFSLEVAQRMMEAQADAEVASRVAHYVVYNTAGLPQLQAKAKSLWGHLLADARKLARGEALPVGPPVVF